MTTSWWNGISECIPMYSIECVLFLHISSKGTLDSWLEYNEYSIDTWIETNTFQILLFYLSMCSFSFIAVLVFPYTVFLAMVSVFRVWMHKINTGIDRFCLLCLRGKVPCWSCEITLEHMHLLLGYRFHPVRRVTQEILLIFHQLF